MMVTVCGWIDKFYAGQVIKALRCGCTEKECADCIYYDVEDYCNSDKLNEDAANLIEALLKCVMYE